MVDYDKYDYVPVQGYSNVLVERDKSYPLGGPQYNFVINEHLVTLIDALIRSRPRWRFVGRRASNTGIGLTVAVSNFYVYDGNEKLGSIDTGVAYRSSLPVRVYRYDTERLERARQRGSWKQTAKLDVARKDILKHFTPKNVSEIIAAQQQKVRAAVQTNASRVGHTFRRAFIPIESHMYSLVMDNWDVMRPILEGMGMRVPEELPDMYARKLAADRAFAAHDTPAGLTVIARANDYIVVRGGTESETKFLTSDELPPHFKRSIGLLKLVEVGHHIDDVGVRCADDTYFIMDRETND